MLSKQSFFSEAMKALALSGVLGMAMPAAKASQVSSTLFGHAPGGEPVMLYTLTNDRGMSVSVMDYGATIVRLLVPDRNGRLANVVLGFDRLEPYLHQTAFMGATIGRYANFIAGGQFEINGKTYQLPKNNGGNSLHGGDEGFDRRLWKVEHTESNPPSIRFSRTSPDGEEGYPGTLKVSVTFTLTPNDELRISYRAVTDRPTIINLTNHTYFNLAGAGSGTILDHVVTLRASAYTPVDAASIPTGQIESVKGTPLDFRLPKAIGRDIKAVGGSSLGYNHNYVLDRGAPDAAEVHEPVSGRVLEVFTDQPGLQFYTGNFLDVALAGESTSIYPRYAGLCLETQHFPDSPHHPRFPSTILLPGQLYLTTTTYAFSTK